MRFNEFTNYDAVGLAHLVAKGDVTPLELVDAAIARIQRHDAALNAVVYANFDQARAAAAGALPDGPLRGIPFLIKDLGLMVEGWPRTSGSRFLRETIDTADSELVRRYRASGLILLGKTNTPEFGITGTTESALLGPCRNPWNPSHIAGGSSGGAAAAVAAGYVPMAHASDGLGSIRIPAACCGLVGLKPTRDRNPSGPDGWEYATGWIHDHIVSRTLRDCAAMLDATGYPEPASPYAYPSKSESYLDEINRSPGKLRIAWSSETPGGRQVDREIEAALVKTAEVLAALGHQVDPHGLGVDYKQLYAAQRTISAANFAAAMARRILVVGREPDPEELEPLTWALLEAGRQVTGVEAFLAWQTLRVLSRRILERFAEFDVYLSPVLGTIPPEIGYIDPVGLDPREVRQRQGIVFPFTPPFNFTGQPSISLPLWQSDSGLPIGMMFTSRYADEATLFRLGGQLEKEIPWNKRRPGIWDQQSNC